MPDLTGTNVRPAARTELRGCMVTGCQLETFAMVVCPLHWKLLPGRLSMPVWAEYSAGYQRGDHPSNGYKQALALAVRWLEENTETPHD